jgi:general secretion pathway protein G
MLLQRRQPKRSFRTAFTLMEVLVVVAILVVLAGIGVGVFRYLDDSKEKAAQLGIKTIETAVVQYKLNTGDFPENLNILAMPEGGKPALLEEKDLFDPWGHPYQYDHNQRSRTGKPLISSQGANPGNPAGQIRNWK